MKASAVSHSNIALIKYWGRQDDGGRGLNLPLNDNVSMTKEGISGGSRLQSHTTVEFSGSMEKDTMALEGREISGRELERVRLVIDPLRRMAGVESHFRIGSVNDFPTAAGLASSAAGFSALALASSSALGLDLTREELSTWARLGSGSAVRSLHGGFVYWHKGSSHETSFAEKVCEGDHFSLNAVIVIVNEGRKGVSSDIGHEYAHTSPFNAIRADLSRKEALLVRSAILDDDLRTVGSIAERNSKYMHAVMMTSDMPLFYWQGETLKVIRSVHAMRERGLEVYFTIDAGPNVHCLCRPEDAPEVQKEMEGGGHVLRTIIARPAKDPHTVDEHLF